MGCIRVHRFYVVYTMGCIRVHRFYVVYTMGCIFAVTVKVYEEIASHFSSTRHTAWPRVCDFLNGLPPGSLVLDVGEWTGTPNTGSCILYSRKFSSAKNFVKSDRQAVRQEFIFVQVGCRSFALRSLRSSLFCFIASLHMHEYRYFCPHTHGCMTKFSQELNLVKKLLWRKQRN